MIVIDTDVLSIHHIFTNDKRFSDNKIFMDFIKSHNCGITVFNLLELCGIISQAGYKNKSEILYQTYLSSGEIKVINPVSNLTDINRMWDKIREELHHIIKRGMRLGDAAILWTIEAITDIQYFITWNTKHYKDKTKIKILTPKEYLDRYCII